jgi:hypothetical protein
MTIRFSDITGGGIPFGDNDGRPANPAIGKLYSNGEAQRLELYTASGWNNIVQEVPGVSGITGNYSQQTDSGTITIAGTNFVTGAIASATGSNGVEVQASTTTFTSIVQLIALFEGLSNQYEPYDIKVTNPSNLFGILPDSLFINASPVWQTASGSLGTFEEQISVSVSATATDSDSTITYSITSGSLPSGVTLNSSTGAISGTLPSIVSDTTYSFTVTASDGVNSIPRSFSISSTNNLSPVWTSTGLVGTIFDTLRTDASISLAATDNENDTLTYALVSGSLPTGMTLSSAGVISGTPNSVSTDTTYSFVASVSDRLNTVTRSFTLVVAAPVTTTYTSGSHTWTAPSGVSKIQLLMVGGGGGGGNSRGNGTGGGGGGAGIVYHPSATVVPRTSYSISVGAGGGAAAANNQSGGPGCVTTGFGATVGGGGGGVSEFNGNCNQPATCSYLPTTSVSGATSGATINLNAGSGGCSFGAGGSGTTHTSSISGSSYTYGGVNNGPSVIGGGGVISSSNGGNGIVIIRF